MKNFINFLLFVCLIFLVMLNNETAFAQSKFYNEEFNFSVTFEDDWYLLSNDYLEDISPTEKKNLLGFFIRKDKGVQLSVRKYDVHHRKEIFDNIIEISKNDKPNFNRVTKTLFTDFGLNLTNVFFEGNNQVYLVFEGREGNKKVKKIVKWFKLKDDFIELEFSDYTQGFKLFNKVNLETTKESYAAFNYPAKHLSNDIEELSKDNSKDFDFGRSFDDRGSNYVDDIVDILNSGFWMLSLFILFLLGIFILLKK